MLTSAASIELLFYLGVSSVAWVVILLFVRFFVFQKSTDVPVFRITPDRREARGEMESCDWLQVIVRKYFEANVVGIQSSELGGLITEATNRFMHLSGGKFELHDINIGTTPPQLCGIECRTESNKTVLLVDVFYQGSFSSSFSLEYPVQLPLLGTSMFPIKVGIDRADVQLRIKVEWDHNEQTLGPTASMSDPSKSLRFPSSKSSVKISLANVPDVSVRLRTEIGARHVICDSQVITSILASIARRRLQSHLIYPNYTTFKFKMPDIVAPPTGTGTHSPRDEMPPRSISPVGVESEGSSADIGGLHNSRHGSNDLLEATLSVHELSSLDGWAGKETSVPPVHLSVLRDHADGLSRVSLLNNSKFSTPNDASQLGGAATSAVNIIRTLMDDTSIDTTDKDKSNTS